MPVSKILSNSIIDRKGDAKAWVTFNASGTILASFNVASVTRTSTGNFSVVFTTAFSSANYVVEMTPETDGNSSSTCLCIVDSSVHPKTGSGFSLYTLNAGASVLVNPTVLHVVCYGNQ